MGWGQRVREMLRVGVLEMLRVPLLRELVLLPDERHVHLTYLGVLVWGVVLGMACVACCIGYNRLHGVQSERPPPRTASDHVENALQVGQALSTPCYQRPAPTPPHRIFLSLCRTPSQIRMRTSLCWPCRSRSQWAVVQLPWDRRWIRMDFRPTTQLPSQTALSARCLRLRHRRLHICKPTCTPTLMGCRVL